MKRNNLSGPTPSSPSGDALMPRNSRPFPSDFTKKTLKRIRRALQKELLKTSGGPRLFIRRGKSPGAAAVSIRGKSIVLEGEVSTLEAKLAAGFAAARFIPKSGGDVPRSGMPLKGVVNDITVRGLSSPEPGRPAAEDDHLEGKSFDVIVIGGGVIGCSVFRELCRYDIQVALFEKESDLCEHTSARNDGMIHPGFAPKPGSKRAHYNVRGNRMYDQLCDELGVPFIRSGSLLLFKHPWERMMIPFMKRRARKNGVDGDYRYLSRRKVLQMEPGITRFQSGGFFLPSAGQLSPFALTAALADNGVENGGAVFLETMVTGMDLEDERIAAVRTNRGKVRTKAVVNAAGLWADRVAGYAGDRFFSLHYRKGVDCILDVTAGRHQRIIAGMPDLRKQRKSKSKGGGIVPCVEGNILVGPTAEEVSFPERYDTSLVEMEDLFTRFEVNPSLDKSQVITYFAGVRACTWEEDFIVEPSEGVKNLIHAAGIQSPGLASAPAIAEDVAGMVVRVLGNPGRNLKFSPRRKVQVKPAELSDAERCSLIEKDPRYGRIVCRCEEISEGEVRDAMGRPVPARTMDGIKRRTRAGAGRCQGGFCTSRIIEIMAEEMGLLPVEVTKKGKGSELLVGETKLAGNGASRGR